MGDRKAAVTVLIACENSGMSQAGQGIERTEDQRVRKGPEPQMWLTNKVRLMTGTVLERLCLVSWARRLQAGCKVASWWRRPPAYSAQGHGTDVHLSSSVV